MTVHQTDPETIREEGVNVLLAQGLLAHGLKARAERRTRKGAPDVRVDLRARDRLVLECKWEGSASLLETQLNRRLKDFPDAIGVIGILYPDRLKFAENTAASLETADDIRWWLHGSRGAALPGPRVVRTGSVSELTDHLRTVPLELEGVDRVVAAAIAVGYAIDQAADRAADHARVSGRIADIIAVTDQEKNRAAALRIGCLVLFNALAFQDRLASVNEEIPTVKEALGEGIAGLRDAWRHICDHIDYIPVFELAANVLDVLNDGPDYVQMPLIKPLVRAVDDTRHIEGHDLSGRLFHTLLTDAKFTGAYYTSVPAATLLARLVFHDWPPQVNWADHEFPASLNVADLACGTGTLLMAVASEAERLHRAAGGSKAPDLHKAMVEQALHGYDVQLSAIHFAATSLAMLNPDIQFDRMNLYVMPFGVQGSNVSLGSLEFFGEDEVPVQYALSGTDMGVVTRSAERVSGRGSQGAVEGVTARLPNLDLAIMNPPFTRTGRLLFGMLPAAERRMMQRELSRRLKSRPATVTAGLGAAFVAAASPKLRPGEGRLALVLPATVCTGQSWKQTRSLIERDYALEMVITSQAPPRWNFSDSTDLSEALLIATRRASELEAVERRTRFVNLWQTPDGVLDAHRVAQAITSTAPAKFEDTGTAFLKVDGRSIGETLSIPESRLVGKKWSGVQFARSDLVRMALRLTDDSELWVPGESKPIPVPMCPLKDIGQLGPDRRDLMDGFDYTDTVTAFPMIEGHNTEQRRTLTTEPDKFLSPLVSPREGRRLKSATQLWQKAARLLVAERLWLETTRVVSMRSTVKVLSNVWWELQVSDSLAEKAIALWLNSSIGLLALLAQRTTTRGGWVALKKQDLLDMPVLDTRRISSTQFNAFADLFDELSDSEFDSLPAMSHCEARLALDDGLSKILNLPDLSTLRTLLATEPVVSNRRL